MKKALSLVICIILLSGITAFGEEDSSLYTCMPECLQMTQKEVVEKPKDNIQIRCTYPSTANAAVDAQICDLVDEMSGEARDMLPNKKPSVLHDLDTGAVIYRTGTKYMSFLVLCQYCVDTEMMYMRHEGRVYDMETGTQLSLTDMFDEDSAGWDILSQAVREQLSAYYPDETADPAALDALCSREALQDACFVMTPCRLVLIYRADTLYQSRVTLMNVNIWYTDIAPYMKEEAREQTDNSRYKKVALTYDDGGAGGYTKRTLNELRNYGANATFFVVGEMFGRNHYNMCRQQNGGYSIQSHNYFHKTGGYSTDELFRWKERMNTELTALIGIGPTLFRAPGGKENTMINANYGMPLIHWSLISYDVSADGSRVDETKVAGNVTRNVKNGDVVLMHDLRSNCDKYTRTIVQYLNDNGWLCLTVEELFHDAGMELLPDQVYYSTTWDYSKE